MPSLERVKTFIAGIEAGDYVATIEAFYHQDATMQENFGALRSGMAALVANEKAALERTDIRARPATRFAIDGDRVFINWVFDMIPRDGGKPVVLDEIAAQLWRGDRIAEERFYYDPKVFRANSE